MVKSLQCLVVVLVMAVVVVGAVGGAGGGKRRMKFEREESRAYSAMLVDESSSPMQFKVVDGVEEGAAAVALYQKESKYNGWEYLSLNTSALFSDGVQAAAAGYLEGYISCESIYYTRLNYLANQFGSSEVPKEVVQWIDSTIGFMNVHIENASQPSVPSEYAQYWTQVNLTVRQAEYMVEGFNAAASVSENPEIKGLAIGIEDIFMLNMHGDLYDILEVVNVTGAKPRGNRTVEEVVMGGECSAIVKLTDDLGELYVGHTTWTVYYRMLKVFKSYHYAFSNATNTNGKSIMFSSYPGVLISLDDFYQITETQLVVTETTNSIINKTLYKQLTPDTVLSWIRVMVSNRMATGGQEWTEIFQQLNSGTYNNQFMIVDYKQFTPYTALNDNAIWIIEQIPGYCESADVTNILRTGYWPSYNIPYFETIYEISGYPSLNSTQVSYTAAPRAQIYRRQANSIRNHDDAKSFLRYNRFETDPLAHSNAWNAVASRGDLNATNTIAMGGIDSKLTSFSMMSRGQVYAILGPTTNDQPVFDWNGPASKWNITHQGTPDRFDFNWMTFSKYDYSQSINE